MVLRIFDPKALEDRKILLRVDFNVPMEGDFVSDSTRIAAHIPTVRSLCEAGAKVALVSHFGRPKGTRSEEFSLRRVLSTVETVLQKKIVFVDDCVGDIVAATMDTLPRGAVALLENVRFHKEEQENDERFASHLAAPFDVFVMDAFSAAHRADASTNGVTKFLPSFAGLLLEREVSMLSRVSDFPERPFVILLGGAKVSDKIGVVEHLLEKATTICIGGGMAFTFLAAQGHRIGRSLLEEDKIPFAGEMMQRAKENGVGILLPVDVLLAKRFEDDTYRVSDVSAIGDDELGLDIGPETVRLFGDCVRAAKTVLWNGPMGVFEREAYSSGTRRIGDALKECTGLGGTTVVGGGDTASAAKMLGFAESVSHVSTGGGASLEFFEGKLLPGIAPLLL